MGEVFRSVRISLLPLLSLHYQDEAPAASHSLNNRPSVRSALGDAVTHYSLMQMQTSMPLSGDKTPRAEEEEETEFPKIELFSTQVRQEIPSGAAQSWRQAQR